MPEVSQLLRYVLMKPIVLLYKHDGGTWLILPI